MNSNLQFKAHSEDHARRSSTNHVQPELFPELAESTFPCTSNPPSDLDVHTEGSEQNSNIFADAACGEPLFSQHLVYDFSPGTDQDNDFVQKKISDFWSFFDSNPSLKEIMVQPNEYNEELAQRTGCSCGSKSDDCKCSTDEDAKSKTAVSMMELLQKRGIANMVFDAKLTERYCPVDMLDYLDDSDVKDNQTDALVKRKNREALQIKKWEEEHPKSMEPPGHASYEYLIEKQCKDIHSQLY